VTRTRTKAELVKWFREEFVPEAHTHEELADAYDDLTGSVTIPEAGPGLLENDFDAVIDALAQAPNAAAAEDAVTRMYRALRAILAELKAYETGGN
jgi:hypothetical protein